MASIRVSRFNNIDVEVVCSLAEVAVQDGDQMFFSLGLILAQGVGDDGEGVGDPVLAHIPIGNLGHGVEAGQGTVDIPAVHGIGTGGQGLSQLAAVRCGTGLFAVHDVRGDSEGREGMDGIAVERVLFQLRGEGTHHIDRLVVGPVIVVAILGEVAFGDKVHGDSLLVANGPHLGVADGGKGVRRHGKSRNAESREPFHMGVVQGHLTGLVGILVVHVVDDVHCVGVELRRVGQDFVVVGPDLFI